MPIVLPIASGGAFARRPGFTVPISGIRTTGVIRCDQMRALDLRARGGKKVDALPQEILDDVLARLTAIFQ
ncbi:MAG TPA: type II toxin-antitoxin system PemK/MazF family toxin [Acidobacteriaceae bacterium]